MKKQFKNKSKINQETFSSTILKSIVILLGFVLFSTPIYAQQVTNADSEAANSTMGIYEVILFLFFCTIGLLLITLLLFARTKNVILKARKGVVDTNAESSFLDKINASVAVENEKDILMDHDYDGIKELDNDLPPWWKYGFYFTIIIAVCYLTYFHILGGDLQIARYEKSLIAAKEAKAAYQKEHGDMINEDNVKLIIDKTQLAEAEKTFKISCSPCHGMDGQGIVGPNLTDDYWIHGGSIKNIFMTITNGWTEKGMKSWKSDFSPLQISQLASYVKSIKGTNPLNPKEKQGDLYVEEGSVSAAGVVKDSTVTPPKDSVKLGTK